MLMLRAFSTFSASSGLKINVAKSEVIFAGVSNTVKQDILQISRFKEGVLPFRYLGIPIQAGRLTRQDCNILVEKIVARVRRIGARKLSYAGRLTLINSVLNTLHNYWSAIFLIPKMVIHRIVAVCRNYLWDGGIEYQRAPLVAWDKVCCSKKTGDSNWNWRNICKVKDRMAVGYVNNSWMPDSKGYSVGSGYCWLQGLHPPVNWHSEIWNRWCVPKHSFIGWLVKHEALNTKDKLYKFHLIANDCRVLCAAFTETHLHIFKD
ncbi:uncharacterized protein LOC141601494 [Silene latifolia]|uniref:uncharacterized protein LOC141601494 n=1 Tax=Silene latifolia TaxID=37657 RepID=UPI003D789BC0